MMKFFKNQKDLFNKGYKSEINHFSFESFNFEAVLNALEVEQKILSLSNKVELDHTEEILSLYKNKNKIFFYRKSYLFFKKY